MLSLAGAQLRVMLSSVIAVQLVAPGVVGGWVSADAPTVSLSRLGPPLAVVAVARTVLLPAFSGALSVLVAQVFQSVVAGNETPVATTAPLTVIVIGRSTVVPLE